MYIYIYIHICIHTYHNNSSWYLRFSDAAYADDQHGLLADSCVC